jgi:prefoldin subunit 2
MATPAASLAKAKPTLSSEQIVAAFNDMRQQQRILVSRMSEIEMDMKEHDLVMEVLKGVDPDRRCYRMVGGILVERKVNVVLPGLISNRDKMKGYRDTLQNSLESKGKELNKFREMYGIQFQADNDEKKDKPAPKAGERQPNILASV